jgi:hypothetical protein
MAPRLRHLAGAAVALALSSGLLGACGGSSSSGNGIASKSPKEIVAETRAAAEKASSVHVSGSIASASAPIALNLDLAAGRGGHGQLSEGGVGFEVIQAGGTVYIKGSPAFYRRIGGPAAAQLLQGKWLKAPATSSDFASISSLTDLRKLIDSTLASHGTLRREAPKTVNGQAAVGVTDVTRGGTLYVATKGKPYPVAIAKAGSGGGKVNFERWNEAVTITPPSGAIDISQLRSGR